MSIALRSPREARLAARLNAVLCLSAILLAANLLLALTVWQALQHQRVEIIPFGGVSAYANSPDTVDARYLSLMAEHFIHARLNVTPETVQSNHQRLLSAVAAGQYTAFLRSLQQEARLIQDKKISSVFHIHQLQVNPNRLTARVQGRLARYVGLTALAEEAKTLLLRFAWRDNRLSLVQFDFVKDESHA